MRRVWMLSLVAIFCGVMACSGGGGGGGNSGGDCSRCEDDSDCDEGLFCLPCDTAPGPSNEDCEEDAPDRCGYDERYVACEDGDY